MVSLHSSNELDEYYKILGHIAMHSVRCDLLLQMYHCLCVCWNLETTVIPAKLAELIGMLFRVGTWVVWAKKTCIHWGPDHPRKEAVLVGYVSSC